MKRIHPTRKERAARGRYSYTAKQLRDPMGRVYSGRPTRKQRRKMKHRRELPAQEPKPFEPKSYFFENGELELATHEPFQTIDLPGNYRYAGIGIDEMGSVMRDPRGEVVFIDEPETITINGEQVPATIVKDPTK